jgi:hypothetical protein
MTELIEAASQPVPQLPKCTCGSTYALGIVHMPNSPCYLPSQPSTDMLGEIFSRQEYFQRLLGHAWEDMTEEERVGYLKDQILALLDETHEALNEMGWKPWASSRHLNAPEFAGELVDILCFLVNLALGVGLTPTQFFQMHEEKALRNIQRQEAKYDGLTGKCPVCKRALDDLIAKGICTQIEFAGRQYCSPACAMESRTHNNPTQEN